MPQIVAAQTYQTLYSFKGSPDGGDPKAGLVIAKDGALYGTTYGGGASVLGTVFDQARGRALEGSRAPQL
ncbi:MAG TPA: choice-of-anchor tandem repeat GloVer-containing protein [Bryobacteraceae bacterium]|nr:choice-of-anchor tandem repeat GloVer-containing protein [Bryobacteraceae bacterium]